MLNTCLCPRLVWVLSATLLHKVEVDTAPVQQLVYSLHKEHVFKYISIDMWAYAE